MIWSRIFGRVICRTIDICSSGTSFYERKGMLEGVLEIRWGLLGGRQRQKGGKRASGERLSSNQVVIIVGKKYYCEERRKRLKAEDRKRQISL